MGHLFIAFGALLAAASVAAGAFGAHGLAARLDPRSLELWDTAVRYLMVGAVGLVVIGILERLWAERTLVVAGWCMLAGAVVFSGTVFALALGAPRVLGALTPIGGLLLIVAFLLVAWAAVSRHLEVEEEAEIAASAVGAEESGQPPRAP
jgi:uncharacterized membrane protein YgdD (TMEM256/DUF423 family)